MSSPTQANQKTERSQESAPMTAERREMLVAFCGMMGVLMLASLDNNIVSTALPRIVGDLGGMAHFSWVITSFMLTSTITTPLYGKFSDLYGRKPMFMIAIGIFLLGSALCGASRTMGQLVLFRGLQGLGAGGLITLAQTAIADLVPPRERGRYQGLFGAVFAFSSVAGPLLGGVITTLFSWRWIFYVNLPVGIAALAMIVIGFKPRATREGHEIDYWGTACMTAATSCLLLLLSWGGGAYAWGSPVILGLGAGAALFTWLFLACERRAAEPLLPLHLFRNKTFVLASCAVSLAFMALFSALVFMPLFLQLVQQLSPAKAGLLLSPMMAGVIVSSITGGRLVSKTGRYKRFPVAGLAVVTTAYIVIGLATGLEGHLPELMATLVLLGLGQGLVMPNLTVAIQNAVEQADLGIATASAAFLRSLGGAIGVAMSGSLMASRLQERLAAGGRGISPEVIRNMLDQGVNQIAALPRTQQTLITEAYRHSIGATFYASALIAAAAFLVILFVPEKPLRTRFEPAETDLAVSAAE